MESRKPRRLASFSYQGEYIYFVTACSDWKRKVFTDKETCESVLETLKKIALKQKFMLHVWCFMPDHLHIVVQGKDDSALLRSFIKQFKQVSSYQYKKQMGKRLWQDGYYEHVLRKEEVLKEVVLYVLQNPTRKGIVSRCLDYPYLGSDTFDVKLL